MKRCVTKRKVDHCISWTTSRCVYCYESKFAYSNLNITAEIADVANTNTGDRFKKREAIFSTNYL